VKIWLKIAVNVVRLPKFEPVNGISCTGCQKWLLVHKKCSGMKGSMNKVMKSFICRGCSNPVTSTGRTSVDIGASAMFG